MDEMHREETLERERDYQSPLPMGGGGGGGEVNHCYAVQNLIYDAAQSKAMTSTNKGYFL